MKRPQLRFYETERQRAAAEFVYTHYLLSLHFGHSAVRDFRVQAFRRKYRAAAGVLTAEDRAKQPGSVHS